MASRETFWNCLSNAGVASLYFWKIMYWICCDRYEQVSFEVLGRVPCNVGEIPSNPWPQEWLLPEFRVQKVAQNLSMKLELWLASQSEKVPWVSAGCHNEMCLPSLRALPHRRRFLLLFVYRCLTCMYVYVSCVCVCQHTMPLEARTGHQIPGTKDTDGFDPPCMCCELNPDL